MNIVEVSPYSLARKGGVQKHVLDLARALRQRGHSVLCVGPGDTISENVIGLGRMRLVSFAGTRFEIARASTQELQDFDRRLAEFKPDIIHYHTMWVPVLPWQIFRRTRTPSIATFHDTTSSDATGAVLRSIFRPLSRYLLNRLDGAIAVSTAPMAHLCPGPRGMVPAILPPVTDLSSFLAVEPHSSSFAPLILYFGRLEPRKGLSVLLDAWKIILRHGKDGRRPQLIIAGSGEMAGAVAEAATGFGQGSIRHIEAPSNEELMALLAAARLAVAPALYGESFGIVLTEALAAGTPVIAAANPGYKHVMTGEGEALLVPVGDASALARRVTALLADEPQRLRLAAWGRHHARRFDVRARIADFEDLFIAACQRHYGLDRQEPPRA